MHSDVWMSRGPFRGSRKYQLSRTLEKGTVPMKAMLVICPIVMAAMVGGAAAESLELRFGPDRERGYRSEREFDGKRRDFENRDRANFLGSGISRPRRIRCLTPICTGLRPLDCRDRVTFRETGEEYRDVFGIH